MLNNCNNETGSGACVFDAMSGGGRKFAPTAPFDDCAVQRSCQAGFQTPVIICQRYMNS